MKWLKGFFTTADGKNFDFEPVVEREVRTLFKIEAAVDEQGGIGWKLMAGYLHWPGYPLRPRWTFRPIAFNADRAVIERAAAHLWPDGNPTQAPAPPLPLQPDVPVRRS